MSLGRARDRSRARGGGAPATAAVAAPTNSVAPVASGAVTIGGTLTTTNGTWTGSPTFTYQWKSGAGNATGAGAPTASYTPVAADIGSAMTCVVTGTNAGGNASGTSNALAFAESDLAPYELWRGDAPGLANPVASWASTGSKGNAAVQGLAPNQPALVATYAALGSQPVVYFDTTAKVLTAGAVADYKFAHNGAGGTLFLVADLTVASATRILAFTQASAAAAQVGFTLYLDSSNRLNFVVGNGAAGIVAAQSTALASGPRVVVIRYSSAARTSGTRAEIRIGRAVNGTAGETGSPSAANASTVLTCGLNTLTCVARWGELALFGSDLSDNAVATLEAYALARYGV